MKKKLVLSALLFLSSFYMLNAQTGWGIKGSLIYNSNGKLIDESSNIIENKGKGESGFNVGAFAKLDLGPIYLQPELVYSQASSEYVIDSETGTKESYKVTSMDLPILLGIGIIGPLNIYAGPAFQFIINNDFGDLNYQQIENDVTVGLNIGLAVKLGRIEIDARYNRGFSSNEASFIENNIEQSSAFFLDTRPQQIIIGLSYRLSAKK